MKNDALQIDQETNWNVDSRWRKSWSLLVDSISSCREEQFTW